MKNRWSIEEAWKFWNENPWMVGCNYVPSLTPGLSIWQEDTIEEILPSVRKELQLMKEIGFNTVRMWFEFDIWYHEREKYLEKDNLYLNDVLSTDIFSAEFNFIGDNANLYFSYLDNENYNYINVNNNVISVYQVLNNSEKLISSVKLNRKYDYTKLHTIRLA